MQSEIKIDISSLKEEYVNNLIVVLVRAGYSVYIGFDDNLYFAVQDEDIEKVNYVKTIE